LTSMTSASLTQRSTARLMYAPITSDQRAAFVHDRLTEGMHEDTQFAV
jgi:hypothetical protein